MGQRGAQGSADKLTNTYFSSILEEGCCYSTSQGNMSKIVGLGVPQFPHLWNRDSKYFCVRIM